MSDNVVTMLERLGNTNGRNEKLAILNECKDIDECRMFFRYILDTKLMYGVTDISMYSPSDNDSFSFGNVSRIVDALSGRMKRKHEYLQKEIANLSKSEYDLLRRILDRDAKVGVSKGLVNAVWTGMVKTNVKLCKAVPLSSDSIGCIEYPAIVQTKMDGARCNAFVLKGGTDVSMYSSNGREYHGLDKLAESLGRTFPKQDVVIDGELLVIEDSGKFSSRAKGNGILNKSLKGTLKDSSNVVFVVWDAIPYSEYVSGQSKDGYGKRLDYLRSNIELSNVGNMSVVNTTLADTYEDVYSCFKEALSRGEEGVILKNRDFTWKGERIPEQIKFKLVMETTLEVIDYTTRVCEPKNGVSKTVLSALVCATRDRELVVKVGSGFTEAYREEFMTRKSKVGFFVEVRSNGIIGSKQNKTLSMFLPRIVEERHDKQEADDIDTVIDLQNMALMLK